MFLAQFGYVGLFLSSFLAATIIPFSSEAVLSFFIYTKFNFFNCILLATLGNWLGGMTGYYLGLLGKWEWLEKYLRVDRVKLERMQSRLDRFGGFTAFFSWLPFVGDLIPVALGVLRCRPWQVWVWMLVGKSLRYLVWGYLTLKVMHRV